MKPTGKWVYSSLWEYGMMAGKGRERKAAGAPGGWSGCVHTQEAKSAESHCCSVPSFYVYSAGCQPGNCGKHTTHTGQVFSPPRMKLKEGLVSQATLGSVRWMISTNHPQSCLPYVGKMSGKQERDGGIGKWPSWQLSWKERRWTHWWVRTWEIREYPYSLEVSPQGKPEELKVGFHSDGTV